MRIGAALRAAAHPNRVLIVDCLTLWLTNLICSEDADALRRETASLLETLPQLAGHCLLIANEVGLGIMPVNALARRFADEAGMLHQALAARCERVILMAAGLPLTLKAPAAPDAARGGAAMTTARRRLRGRAFGPHAGAAGAAALVLVLVLGAAAPAPRARRGAAR